MKNFVALCATALALAAPGVAQAADNFGTAGTYKFTGTVQVKKNLSSWTTCGLEVEVVVGTGGTTATAKSTLSGTYPCGSITFGPPSPNSIDATGPGPVGSAATGIKLLGVKTNIPPVLIFPSDACLGDLAAAWGGNAASPRFIVLGDPLSDTPDTNPDNPGATENPCKITGTLTQTSGAAGGLVLTL